jgi:uncharacterized protein
VKHGFKVMDSDIHVQEPRDLWARYIEPQFKERAPQFTNIPDGSTPGVWRFEGKVFPAYIDRPERQRLAKVRRRKAHDRHEELGREVGPEEERRGEDPEAMLHAMDVEGIDVSIVFRTRAAHVIAVDGLDAELTAAVCRAFNNWLVDFCKTNRARLKPAALLPVHDVKLAVPEARRSVQELGAVALVLPNQQVNGRPWYDQYYDPLWAEAEKLRVPVAFHGIQMAYQEHLGRRYLDNFAMAHAVGHPVEMMLALGSMLTGGVFERFPRLTAAFLEGHCGWVPSWLWCLDERVEKFGDDERFPLKMPPSEYFRRHCYVSVDPDEAVVRHTIEAIGDENIVISSDWPHDDSAYPRAIETFLQLDGVSEASKRKILWDNCARLYGIQ